MSYTQLVTATVRIKNVAAVTNNLEILGGEHSKD